MMVVALAELLTAELEAVEMELAELQLKALKAKELTVALTAEEQMAVATGETELSS
jgi:hypothetical protein